jgi:hypothetical protein
MTIEVREEHSKKAYSLISFRPLGITTEIRDEHPQNALPPMVVTLFGMVIETSDEQSSKASSPIVSTMYFIPSQYMCDGMTTSPAYLDSLQTTLAVLLDESNSY